MNSYTYFFRQPYLTSPNNIRMARMNGYADTHADWSEWRNKHFHEIAIVRDDRRSDFQDVQSHWKERSHFQSPLHAI